MAANVGALMIPAALELLEWWCDELHKEALADDVVHVGWLRALVGTLCKLANGRVRGAARRLGSAAGASAACGHWVGASHDPSLGDWSEHE